MAQQKKKLGLQVEKNIYKRGDYSFQVKMMIHGHKLDKTFDTLDEARTFRDLERSGAALDVSEGMIYEARAKRREAKNFTFGDAIKKYRPISEQKRGFKQEAASLNLLSRLPITSKPLYMIHKQDLLKMFEDIKSGEYKKVRSNTKNKVVKEVTEATLRRYSILVRHIFEVAQKVWKKIDKNPFDQLDSSEKPKDSKPRDRRLKGDEYTRLMKELGLEAQVALDLLIETGMRKQELFNLEWQHVKFSGKHGSARVKESKNGEERTVPLSSKACQALKKLTRGVSGPLFQELTYSGLNHQWRDVRAKIGSPDLRVHDLRHEATSRLFEDKNLNVIETALITGHKSLAMLRRYANLNVDKLAKKLG